MRDDNTEPRDNQQIADDGQQSEIDLTRRKAEAIADRDSEKEADSPYDPAPRRDRAEDEPAD